MLDVLLTASVSFIISFLAIPVVLQIAEQKKLYDIPDERKVHTRPVASLGGVGIFGGFLLASLLSIQGHISPVFYSTLARAGYFDIKELSTFRKIDSRLQGHPTTHEHLPGVRIASGSLGQGMSAAIGAALTKKLNKENTTIYSLHGDGELQEGQIWEAVMFAAHHKVDNLISTVDWNGQQIDGPTKKVMNLGDLGAKFAAFDWEVIKLEKGNDINEVVKALEHARTFLGKGKPIVILMTTAMGKGVDFMEGSHEWHGIAPNDEQLARALAQLPETLGDY